MKEGTEEGKGKGKRVNEGKIRSEERAKCTRNQGVLIAPRRPSADHKE